MAASTTPQQAADAAAQLQSQLAPSPLVPAPAGQDPSAAMQALMAQMKDIHLPAPISNWPPAPGWWVLGISLLLLLVGGLTWWYVRRRRTAYRRAGLRLLRHISPTAYNPQRLARLLNEILKRTALASPLYKGMGVAAAHGGVWAQFLCNTCNAYPQKEELTAQLVKALDQPKVKLDGEALFNFCQFWINHHQPLLIAGTPSQEVAHAAV